MESRRSPTTRLSSLSEVFEAGRDVGLRGPLGQLVHDVAQRGDLLSDAVVDLACQPLAFVARDEVRTSSKASAVASRSDISSSSRCSCWSDSGGVMCWLW